MYVSFVQNFGLKVVKRATKMFEKYNNVMLRSRYAVQGVLLVLHVYTVYIVYNVYNVYKVL